MSNDKDLYGDLVCYKIVHYEAVIGYFISRLSHKSVESLIEDWYYKEIKENGLKYTATDICMIKLNNPYVWVCVIENEHDITKNSAYYESNLSDLKKILMIEKLSGIE